MRKVIIVRNTFARDASATDVLVKKLGHYVDYKCSGSGEELVQGKATRTNFGRPTCLSCGRQFPKLQIGQKAPEHAPLSNQQRSGIYDASRSEAEAKIQAASRAQLQSALSNPKTDPQIKKLIEKELDYRADHGQSRDGVGSREDVVYGEGYHSTSHENPYTNDPKLAAAWQKGRSAAKQKGNLRQHYYAGETRGKRFESPKVRDAIGGGKLAFFSKADKEARERRQKQQERFERNQEIMQEFRKASPERKAEIIKKHGKMLLREGIITAAGSEIPRPGDSEGPSFDYKSERGWIGKVFNLAGSLLAQSDPFISERSAKGWLSSKIEEYARRGMRVVTRTASVFFDPMLVQDTARGKKVKIR